MFKMTFNQALLIQEYQMAWYRRNIGRKGIKEIRKRTKYPAGINPNELMSVFEINRLVPRGGSFERYVYRYPHDPEPNVTMAVLEAIKLNKPH